MASKRVCAWCGTPFQTNKLKKIHCSDRCRDVSYRAGFRFCTICGLRYEITEETKKYLTHCEICDVKLRAEYEENADRIKCHNCGRSIIRVHPNQRYCDDKCKMEMANKVRNQTSKALKKPKRKMTHEDRVDEYLATVGDPYQGIDDYFSMAQYNPLG